MTAQPTSAEHLLTPAQVAARVFVDPKTVSRWARAGKIASERTPGGHRRFHSADVDTLVSASRTRRPRDERASPAAVMGAQTGVALVAADAVDHAATSRADARARLLDVRHLAEAQAGSALRRVGPGVSARVAQAADDAIERLDALVVAFDRAVDQETAAAVEALRDLMLPTG